MQSTTLRPPSPVRRLRRKSRRGTVKPVISHILADAANRPEEYVKRFNAGRGAE